MIFTSLQSAIDKLTPPRGVKPVGDFLTHCAKALRARTDADLARHIGIPASNIGNWKRRGVIPDRYHDWFTKNLPTLILSYHDQPVTFSLEAQKIIVDLLIDFNNRFRWKKSSDTIYIAMHLEGMAHLAELLVNLSDENLRGDREKCVAQAVDELAALMLEALPSLLPNASDQGPQSGSAKEIPSR